MTDKRPDDDDEGFPTAAEIQRTHEDEHPGLGSLASVTRRRMWPWLIAAVVVILVAVIAIYYLAR